MAGAELYPRILEERLARALTGSSLVLIHGPRQCGKTALARAVGEQQGFVYVGLGDDLLGAARLDPVGFVDDLPDRAIVDDIQRVPGVLAALTQALAQGRSDRRCLLTSSSSVTAAKLADSAPKRTQILRLHPFAQGELARRPSRFLNALFAGSFKSRRAARLGTDLNERIVAGGYPAPNARPAGQRRAWYRDHLDASIQRDARTVARLSSPQVLSRLLALAAAQTGRLQNVSSLSSPFQLSRPTIHGYLTLLERLFLVDALPPWRDHRLSRLVKTPKLHMGDSGLACALLGADAGALHVDRALRGQLLETFVFQELRRQASSLDEPHAFFHFRDKDGAEVDIVIEQGTRWVAGIDVKAGATVTSRDFGGLRKLAKAAGRRFAGGVVLHDGEAAATFEPRLHAVPIRWLCHD